MYRCRVLIEECMPGVSASHRANYGIGGKGNTTQPLQSVGDLFGGIIGGSSSIDEFHDEVCYLLLWGEVVHNPGNAWCTQVIGCHAMDILLRLMLEAQRVMAAILYEVRFEDYTSSITGLSVVSFFVSFTERNDLLLIRECDG